MTKMLKTYANGTSKGEHLSLEAYWASVDKREAAKALLRPVSRREGGGVLLELPKLEEHPFFEEALGLELSSEVVL